MTRASIIELVTALLVVAGLTATAFTLETAERAANDIPTLQALQAYQDEQK